MMRIRTLTYRTCNLADKMKFFQTLVIYYKKEERDYQEVVVIAKAVPVKVRLSVQAVDMACLQKSLETLHMCVVAEAIQGENYSEQQVAALLIAMQKKLLENEEGRFVSTHT